MSATAVQQSLVMDSALKSLNRQVLDQGHSDTNEAYSGISAEPFFTSAMLFKTDKERGSPVDSSSYSFCLTNQSWNHSSSPSKSTQDIFENLSKPGTFALDQSSSNKYGFGSNTCIDSSASKPMEFADTSNGLTGSSDSSVPKPTKDKEEVSCFSSKIDGPSLQNDNYDMEQLKRDLLSKKDQSSKSNPTDSFKKNSDLGLDMSCMESNDFDFNPATKFKQDFDFESTELAMRLKSTMKSEFMSKEFWPNSTPNSGEVTRSIDDIMRDYGINSAGSSLLKSSVPNSNGLISSQLGHMNMSANNESIKAASGGFDTCNPTRGSYSQNNNHPQAVGNDFSLKTSQTPGCFDNPTTGPFKMETTLSNGMTTQIINSSQNNETEAQTQNNEEQQVRDFGSSVDYGASANAAPKHTSTSRTSQIYPSIHDIGRTGNFAGDIPYTSTNKYSSLEYKQFDTSTLQPTTSFSSKYSNMDFKKTLDQILPDSGLGHTSSLLPSELSKTIPTTRPSNYPMYSHLGTAADALGFSLQAERQRLRDIDAMIATTPFHSRAQDPLFTKPYTYSKYSSGNSYMSSDLEGRRRYSTPALNSSLPYRSEMSTRMDWSTGLGGHHGMGKSVSAPNYEYSRNVTATTGSSVDAQLFSRGAKGGSDVQYNNCTYNPALVDKIISDKKSAPKESHLQRKKSDCPLKKVNKGSPSRSMLTRPQSASNFKQSKDGVAERKRNGTASAPRGDNSGRKKNTNQSKSVAEFASGFDFVKDLNKLWQQSVLGTETKKVTRPPKYQPYRPASVQEPQQTCKPNNSWQENPSGQMMPIKSQSCWVGREPSVKSSFHDGGFDISLNDWQQAPSLDYSSRGWEGDDIKTKNKSVKATKSFTLDNYATPKSILKPTANKSFCRSNSAMPIRSQKSNPGSPQNHGVTTAQLFAGLTLKRKATANKQSRAKTTQAKLCGSKTSGRKFP